MLHGDLTGRWWTMPLLDQMANGGADVGRALTPKAAGDEARTLLVLDLIDLTMANPRWAASEVKEIATMREVVCNYVVGHDEHWSTPEWIDDYFAQIGLAARADR